MTIKTCYYKVLQWTVFPTFQTRIIFKFFTFVFALSLSPSLSSFVKNFKVLHDLIFDFTTLRFCHKFFSTLFSFVYFEFLSFYFSLPSLSLFSFFSIFFFLFFSSFTDSFDDKDRIVNLVFDPHQPSLFFHFSSFFVFYTNSHSLFLSSFSLSLFFFFSFYYSSLFRIFCLSLPLFRSLSLFSSQVINHCFVLLPEKRDRDQKVK